MSLHLLIDMNLSPAWVPALEGAEAGLTVVRCMVSLDALLRGGDRCP